MRSEFADIFELYRESVVVLENDVPVYMNSAARDLFGGFPGNYPAGLSLPHKSNSLFTGSYTFNAAVGDSEYCISVSRLDDALVVSLIPASPFPSGDMLPGLIPSLRDAVSVVGMSASLLDRHAESEADGDLDRYCAMLFHSYHMLRRVIGNLSAVSGNVCRRDAHTVDLVGLCAETVRTAGLLIADKGIRSVFESSLSALHTVIDTHTVEDILFNLLSNAIKHTPAGGTVHVSLEKNGANAIITVRDNGSGIAPDVLPTLFSRYSEKRNPSDPNAGSGLGLAAVRALAESVGGSVVGGGGEHGAVFAVSLPIREPSSGELHTPHAEFGEGLSDVLTGLADVLDYTCYGREYRD